MDRGRPTGAGWTEAIGEVLSGLCQLEGLVGQWVGAGLKTLRLCPNINNNNLIEMFICSNK